MEEYIRITRHAFVPQLGNSAKYGNPAPKAGFINVWQEEISAPATVQEWDHLNEWLREEYAAAVQEALA